MVPAVDRTFQILDLLSRSSSPLGTSEVARRLRLPKSTAHGLLHSLEAVGAVAQTRRRYRLGPALERLAAVVELRRRWRPVLEEVAESTGASTWRVSTRWPRRCRGAWSGSPASPGASPRTGFERWRRCWSGSRARREARRPGGAPPRPSTPAADAAGRRRRAAGIGEDDA